MVLVQHLHMRGRNADTVIVLEKDGLDTMTMIQTTGGSGDAIAGAEVRTKREIERKARRGDESTEVIVEMRTGRSALLFL